LGIKGTSNSNGLADEETAKGVWLSILSEYDSYAKMEIWLPENILDEHRMVAKSLGWIQK